MKRRRGHAPVLLAEVLDALAPRPGDVVVDCTVGLAGHAAALAERVGPTGRVIGLDLDPGHVSQARAALARFGTACTVVAANYAALPTVLAEAGVAAATAVLADLGVASTQLDDPVRGFSWRLDGPLDMRFDPTRGRTAADLVNAMSEEALADALRDLGDEEDAAPIARLVCERRARAPLCTTGELMALVCEARDFTLARARGAKLHPATRTFQVLRMLVNRELANLERLLAVLPDCLAPGGRAALLTFHSGEDRLVKRAFREGARAGTWAAVSAEPIRPTAAEAAANRRARSAKLRWARRA